jgi:hypothetical protein
MIRGYAAQVIASGPFELPITEHNRNIPVDFSQLDLRFLPYYLLSERVRVEWNIPPNRDWIIAENLKTFYVGLHFVEGYQSLMGLHVGQPPPIIVDPHNTYNTYIQPSIVPQDGSYTQTEPHLIIFHRLRTKNAKKGYDMESDLIDNITGSGTCNPNMEGWTMDNIIKHNMDAFIDIRNGFPNWVNEEGFKKAINDFCGFKTEYN